MKALLIAIVVIALVSCSSIRQKMPAQREAKQRAEQLQELQLNVMRFADEYRYRIVEMTTSFQVKAENPEERLLAQNWKLQQVESIYTIASGPNPLTNALDTVVLASLSRMVLDDPEIKKSYGERAAPLLDAHRVMEEQSWKLVSSLLTAPQMQQVREEIARWREEHPDVRAVGGIRFSDFAKSASAPGQEATRGGLFSMFGLDPFSKLDPAVREIAQTRQLAERAIFYLQRMPTLLNMQMERFTDQVTTMPETKSLLASVDRASLIGSAADRLTTSLPDIIAKERAAFLSQLTSELGNQRNAIGAISGDLRSTLQAGTETLTALQTTLTTVDRLSAQFRNVGDDSKSGRARPFDIREYNATLQELSTAIRELDSLTQHLDSALPIVRNATENVTASFEGVLDKAFRQLLLLIIIAIVGALLAALAYRAIVFRLQRRVT